MFWIKHNKTELETIKRLFSDYPICVLGDSCYVFRDHYEFSQFLDRNPRAEIVFNH